MAVAASGATGVVIPDTVGARARCSVGVIRAQYSIRVPNDISQSADDAVIGQHVPGVALWPSTDERPLGGHGVQKLEPARRLGAVMSDLKNVDVDPLCERLDEVLLDVAESTGRRNPRTRLGVSSQEN